MNPYQSPENVVFPKIVNMFHTLKSFYLDRRRRVHISSSIRAGDLGLLRDGQVVPVTMRNLPAKGGMNRIQDVSNSDRRDIVVHNWLDAG